MRRTTIRELKKNTATVLSWVAQGETVEVFQRNQPVAMLTPPAHKRAIVFPDFTARLKAIYGNRILPTTGTEVVSKARGQS